MKPQGILITVASGLAVASIIAIALALIGSLLIAIGVLLGASLIAVIVIGLVSGRTNMEGGRDDA